MALEVMLMERACYSFLFGCLLYSTSYADLLCEIEGRKQDYLKILKSGEVSNVLFSHALTNNEEELRLETILVNQSDQTLIIEKWNNFHSPPVRVFEYEDGVFKFVPNKSEILVNQKDAEARKTISCNHIVLLEKSLSQKQYLQFDLDESYKFVEEKLYCFESKELHLPDFINHEMVITSSPVLLVWFDGNWNQQILPDNSYCDEGPVLELFEYKWSRHKAKINNKK